MTDAPTDTGRVEPADDARIAELKALLANATPGPWSFDHDWHRIPTILGPDKKHVADIDKSRPSVERKANASLVEAARNTLPALLARIEQMQATIERLGTEQSDGANYNTELFVEIEHLRATVAAQSERIERMEGALRRIEKWFGEFPDTGQKWPVSGEPVSYGACYGSNGERDFMRGVARSALPATEGTTADEEER